MAFTARELITNAWYLSGIVADNYEVVSGDQIIDGLYLLNALLAVKTADKRMIPYYQYTTINLIQNQEVYFVPNLLELDPATFNIGPVRYAMSYIDRRQYFGAPRVDNISSLPFSYTFERVFGGGNIYVYFLPESNYPLKFMGKFSLSAVTLDQDLSLTIDWYFIEYLRYGLAEKMCEQYTVSMTPSNDRKLREYENLIMDISPLDLTLEVVSNLGSGAGINWGDVNLGRGYRP